MSPGSPPTLISALTLDPTIPSLTQKRSHIHPAKLSRQKLLSFVRGISEAVRCTLAPLKVRVCYKPHRTLKQLLSNPKDTVPDLQKSGVVYQIPCASCSPLYMYFGQSGRKPETTNEKTRKSGGYCNGYFSQC